MDIKFYGGNEKVNVEDSGEYYLYMRIKNKVSSSNGGYSGDQ